MPPMEPYDGTSDPWDHVESFKTLILQYGASDTLLYKAFSVTFYGPTQAWFVGLESSSIHSFNQFTCLFVSHFAVSSRQRLISDSLFNVQ